MLLFFSCSENDTTVDFVLDNVESGGILRTLEVSPTLSISDPEESFELLLEVQDEENGDLSDFIEVYASFSHLTGGGVNDRDELLLKTVANSEWMYGERLPRALVTATLPELEAALDLDNGDYSSGDRFVIRVELVFKDGRRWSDYNASSTLLGNQFFNTPFVYNANVVN